MIVCSSTEWRVLRPIYQGLTLRGYYVKVVSSGKIGRGRGDSSEVISRDNVKFSKLSRSWLINAKLASSIFDTLLVASDTLVATRFHIKAFQLKQKEVFFVTEGHANLDPIYISSYIWRSKQFLQVILDNLLVYVFNFELLELRKKIECFIMRRKLLGFAYGASECLTIFTISESDRKRFLQRRLSQNVLATGIPGFMPPVKNLKWFDHEPRILFLVYDLAFSSSFRMSETNRIKWTQELESVPLLKIIKTKLPRSQITVRPHPSNAGESQKLNDWLSVQDSNKIELTAALNEIDLVVTFPSTAIFQIHALGIPCIVVDVADKAKVESNLMSLDPDTAVSASDEESLGRILEHLDKGKFERQRRKFLEDHRPSFDGQAELRIVDTIENHLLNGTPCCKVERMHDKCE